MQQTTVKVELFGMPRVIAGTDHVDASGDRLDAILHSLIVACPELASHLTRHDDQWLNRGYIFVVDGAFVSDPEHPITPDSTILLVSRASGG